jgi:hypothetical protein
MSFAASDTLDVNFSLDRLFHVVEAELRKQARFLRASRPSDPVLQTALLVNEAFLLLTNGPPKAWQDQSHFLRISYGLMKRILADYYRRRWPGQLPQQFVDFYHRPQSEAAESVELMDDFAEAFEQLDSTDPSASAAFSLCIFHSISLSNRVDLLKVIREGTGERPPMRELADRLDTSAAGVCRALNRAITFLSCVLRGHAD